MKNFSVKDFFIKSLNGMSLGLFSSLLIGLIIKQLGSLLKLNALVNFGTVAQFLMGPAIGVGVSYSLGSQPMGIFSSVVIGAIGAGTISFSPAPSLNIGEPVGAYLAVIVGMFFTSFLNKDSSFKIISYPLVGIILGGLAGTYISPPISYFMTLIGQAINLATDLRPLPMGIIISMLMGILLTLPISSAAIAISLNLSGLAAGASVVGCCCQMIGFAVISYRDNKFPGFLAQGLGSSMLQISNIIKNPLIWVPPTLASGILGPLSSSLLKMENNMLGAGMGTSGLVGQVSALDTMGFSLDSLIKVILMHFILPGIISFLIYLPMYKNGLIKDGDMKI